MLRTSDFGTCWNIIFNFIRKEYFFTFAKYHLAAAFCLLSEETRQSKLEKLEKKLDNIVKET